MKYGEVQGVKKPVSRLVMGADIITSDELERSFALLDAGFELGWNTIDAAWIYGGGKNEGALGQWMEARGNREDVVILSKCSHPWGESKRVTPADIASDLHDTLERLRSDYVDLYLLHRDDPDVPVGPIVEAFNEHHRAGRIRAFGGSNWTHERLQEANDYAAARGLVPFTASSPNYSLAEQVKDPWGAGCTTVTGAANAEARRWYEDQRMPLFAYSSLARGLLSGRMTRENYEELADGACRAAYCYEVNFQRLDRARELAAEKGVTVPQIGLAYVFARPLNVFALVGVVSREECEADTAALDLELTPKEAAWLNLESETR